MNRNYLNKIIDYGDEETPFVDEFNKEIAQYGAIVYNHETNSYQFIRQFDHIDFKKEILPFYFMVNESAALKAITITMSYEFDPETEEDEENLEIWKELKKTELAILDYAEDGDVQVKEYINLNTNETKHTIWFLTKEGFEELTSNDPLLYTPVIKNIHIAQKIIKDFTCNPADIESTFDQTGKNDYVENLNTDPVYH